MAANTRQETARRYLLGQMSQEEATEFESEFFADDDLFEEMSSLENDLIDSFVRGELSERERRQFETGYITCQARRENVEFARQLLTHIEEPPQAFSFAKLNVAQEIETSSLVCLILAPASCLRYSSHSHRSYFVADHFQSETAARDRSSASSTGGSPAISTRGVPNHRAETARADRLARGEAPRNRLRQPAAARYRRHEATRARHRSFGADPRFRKDSE